MSDLSASAPAIASGSVFTDSIAGSTPQLLSVTYHVSVPQALPTKADGRAPARPCATGRDTAAAHETGGLGLGLPVRLAEVPQSPRALLAEGYTDRSLSPGDATGRRAPAEEAHVLAGVGVGLHHGRLGREAEAKKCA